MEVITIETKAFRRIMERLEVMEEYICQARLGQKAVLADDDWVDSAAVCRYLRICDKTLQRLRLDGKISYSVIGKKNYYQIAEIKRCLKEHIIRRPEEMIEGLIGQYHTFKTAKQHL